MSRLHHEILIEAPPEAVWNVLADLRSPQRFNPMVATTELISERTEGVGAARYCTLRPKGWVKERVTGWWEGSAIEIEVAESEWPLVFMKWKTQLHPEAGGTRVSQDLDYRLKFGSLGALMDVLVMRRKLDRDLDAVFKAMKQYVESNTNPQQLRSA